MVNKIARSFFIFLASISAISISTANAVSANDTIGITTALLRGPAAYLEYELRNDTSRSAHAQKALIAAIRLVNDLHSPTTQLQHHAFGWFLYDAKEIFVHLKALLTAQKQPAQLTANTTEKQTLSDDKDHQLLRRIVLPMIEMLGALGRTELVRNTLPHRGGCFTGIATTMSRLGQLYLAAPQNSTDRKIIIALFTWCFVDILTEIKRLHDEIKYDRMRAAILLRREEWLQIAREEDRRRQQPAEPQQEIRFVDRNEKVAGNPKKLFFTGESPKECPLCAEEKSINDLCTLPGCGHVHCKNCIMNWLKKSKTCPECKRPCDHIIFNVSQQDLDKANTGKK